MSETLNIYVFASNTLTNIWAGIGAEMWAVAPTSDPKSPHAKGRITKAGKLQVGALGILYSSADSALTSPFIVRSSVNNSEVIKHVWPECWVLPFRIQPLGSPHKRLTIADAKACLPSLLSDQSLRFDHLFRVRADFAFQTSQITSADWSVLIEKLAHDAQTH